MENNMNGVINAVLSGYYVGSAAENQPLSYNKIEIEQAIVAVFEAELDFMAKTNLLDELVDRYPLLDGMREVLFDLLMVNFFTADAQRLDENYLDSEEWAKIEDKTIDRGTELLNVFLYILECIEENVEPSLEDYLKEFLLVEEDEFQDELAIYEDIIAHQVLVESDPKEIARVATALPASSEMKELFYPLMAWFYEVKPDENQIKAWIDLSKNKAFDTAVLFAILASANGQSSLKKFIQ